MKLYTDAFNVNALKILAVAEYCGEDVELEKPRCSEALDKKNNRVCQLPILQTTNRYEYFSSNAACRYLFIKNNKKIGSLTENWLEWESSVFQPLLVNCFNVIKTAMPDELKSCLQYLNVVLGKQDFLSCTKEYGLEDIVIWSDVYPLFDVYSLDSVFSFLNIKSWFSRLKEQKPFADAVTKVFGTTQRDCLRKLLSYNTAPVPQSPHKYFLPITVPDFSPEISSPVVSKESVEVVKEDTFTLEEVTSAYASWLKGPSALPQVKQHDTVVLPKKSERNVLITSALPYVNNVPHLGNIIGAVLSADVFARYCRLRNFNTLFICGTDEYGTATETKAIELGVTPKEICDRFNKLHAEIYNWFNISFDYFGRTTTAQQTKIAQEIFMKLYNRNLLIEKVVEQLYCTNCERFLADRFVEGTCPFCLYEEARGDQCDKCGKLIDATNLIKPACKVCKSTPRLKETKHQFLDLPKLEPELKLYLEKATKSGQWSNTAKVITNSWIKDGLKPRCITRDLKWGTPVPLNGFTDKVFYVWFDAPIGYLSITANYTDRWEEWWKQPDLVQLYQFMAKDNVPFHSIIFPACQLGTKDGYTLVNHLAATEYLNYEDVKFSKSRGLGVFGDDAQNTGIPSDIWRFYLLYLRPENQDTYFSWNDLMLKNNCELLNNLGNFINRALMFITNNFNGVIPEMKLTDVDKYLLAQVGRELNTYINYMEKTKLRDAIRTILNISKIGNQYIQSHKPWELIKGSVDDKVIAGTVLGLSANVVCLLCTLMEPYMPGTCQNLRMQLNSRPEFHILTMEFVCLLEPGHQLGKPAPLFEKIDEGRINSLKAKYAGRQSPESSGVDAKKSGTGDVALANGVNEAEIEKLNGLITCQGNKVRQLKTEKADKSEVDKEVVVLLDLKRKLAILKGENPDPPKGKSKSKSKKVISA